MKIRCMNRLLGPPHRPKTAFPYLGPEKLTEQVVLCRYVEQQRKDDRQGLPVSEGSALEEITQRCLGDSSSTRDRCDEQSDAVEDGG